MPSRSPGFMPSDSPVIITDGSFEAYTAKDDFDQPPNSGKTYRIQKNHPATAIKFFGTTISLADGDTWKVTVAGTDNVATIAPDPKDSSALIITATNTLNFRNDQMAQVSNTDFVDGISVSVNNGSARTFQSDCHIKFRKEKSK